MSRFWSCVLSTSLVLVATGIVSAAELTVGPGKPFQRIEDALAKAQNGDTILVSALCRRRSLRESGGVRRQEPHHLQGRPASAWPLSGKDFDYSGRGSIPRAIFQFSPGADGCVLDGFDLSGAHNDSHNGAGVRINQANDVTIRNCRIHGNDMGIMSNGDGTPKTAAGQLIESCLIYSNGDKADPGYNHNLYLGGTSVTLLGCEVHSSLTGHNVKSRAHLTVVAGCYIHDSANREFDLVDAKGDTTVPGSNALLAGNIIIKAAKCEGNKGVIHFGQDGGNEHDGTITLLNNTIVTPLYLAGGGARCRQGPGALPEQHHLGRRQPATRPETRGHRQGRQGRGPGTNNLVRRDSRPTPPPWGGLRPSWPSLASRRRSSILPRAITTWRNRDRRPAQRVKSPPLPCLNRSAASSTSSSPRQAARNGPCATNRTWELMSTFPRQGKSSGTD